MKNDDFSFQGAEINKWPSEDPFIYVKALSFCTTLKGLLSIKLFWGVDVYLSKEKWMRVIPSVHPLCSVGKQRWKFRRNSRCKRPQTFLPSKIRVIANNSLVNPCFARKGWEGGKGEGWGKGCFRCYCWCKKYRCDSREPKYERKFRSDCSAVKHFYFVLPSTAFRLSFHPFYRSSQRSLAVK